MPRDLKVGFALGVLLVGVVGALFFRRDPSGPTAPPALQTAAEIDKQVAEQPKGPYMLGPEEFVDEGAEDDAPPRKLTETRPAAPAYDVPEFLNPEDRREQQAVIGGAAAPAPDPVGTAKPAPSVAKSGRTAPQHNTGWETTRAPASISIDDVDPLGEDDSPFANADTPSPNSGNSATTGPISTYITRPGDTLSALAGKFLGSQGRFRELYEMNKQVLRSPDDLPEGVTLTVPAQVPAPKSAVNGGRTTRKPAAATVGQGWDTVSDQPAPPAAEPRSRDTVSNPEARQPRSEQSPVMAKDGSGAAPGSMFRASQRGRLGAGRQSAPVGAE
jgi:hypothetical protein